MERLVFPETICEETRLREKKLTVFCSSKSDKILLHSDNGTICIAKCNMLNPLTCRENSYADYFKLRKSVGLIDDNSEKKEDCHIIQPDFFMIDLTDRCNMACKYCLRDINATYHTIDDKTLYDVCQYIIQYCERKKLEHISVQAWGGEPLLALEKILKMCKWLKPSFTKVHFSIETNGLLLNSDIIKTLITNNVEIGVSIDGLQEQHDNQRISINETGTHRIVEQNIKIAKNDYRIDVGTITTITRMNFDDVEKIIEYFATDLGLNKIKFNFVHRSKFRNNDDLCLSNELITSTVERIVRKIVSLNKQGIEIREYNMMVKLKNIVCKQNSDICHSRGCCGGYRFVTFDQLGNFFPCELTDFPKFSLGNIYSDSILEKAITNSIPQNDFFIEKKSDKCADCDWYIYCRGGCTSRIISSSEIMSVYDDIECAVNTKIYPLLIELILEEPEIVNMLLKQKKV